MDPQVLFLTLTLTAKGRQEDPFELLTHLHEGIRITSKDLLLVRLEKDVDIIGLLLIYFYYRRLSIPLSVYCLLDF